MGSIKSFIIVLAIFVNVFWFTKAQSMEAEYQRLIKYIDSETAKSLDTQKLKQKYITSSNLESDFNLKFDKEELDQNHNSNRSAYNYGLAQVNSGFKEYENYNIKQLSRSEKDFFSKGQRFVHEEINTGSDSGIISKINSIKNENLRTDSNMYIADLQSRYNTNSMKSYVAGLKTTYKTADYKEDYNKITANRNTKGSFLYYEEATDTYLDSQLNKYADSGVRETKAFINKNYDMSKLPAKERQMYDMLLSSKPTMNDVSNYYSANAKEIVGGKSVDGFLTSLANTVNVKRTYGILKETGKGIFNRIMELSGDKIKEFREITSEERAEESMYFSEEDLPQGVRPR